jgi:hypothetical protein
MKIGVGRSTIPKKSVDSESERHLNTVCTHCFTTTVTVIQIYKYSDDTLSTIRCESYPILIR